LLRNFGLKIGIAGGTKFEARIKELVENLPDLAVLVEPLLIVSRVLHEQIGVLHRRLLTVVRDDEVCRRLMTVPGVGPVVALTYRAAVDVPPTLHHDFGDAEPAMSADWSSQSELRIAKASGSARPVNVVSLTSDMTSLRNKVWPWIQGISSISDEYAMAN
jgi:hypothetical protein